jgi:hypothetical protein
MLLPAIPVRCLMLNKNHLPLWIVASGMAVLLIVVISMIAITEKHEKRHKEELAHACKSQSGTWLENYGECEYVDRQWCTAAGGRFDECGSACRHSPDPAAPCTMQCIPVCAFSSEGTSRVGKGPPDVHALSKQN